MCNDGMADVLREINNKIETELIEYKTAFAKQIQKTNRLNDEIEHLKKVIDHQVLGHDKMRISNNIFREALTKIEHGSSPVCHECSCDVDWPEWDIAHDALMLNRESFNE